MVEKPEELLRGVGMIDSKIQQRAAELMEPIERQIMLCDDRNETLLFACAMLEKAKTIIESHIGKQGRKELFIMGNER